MKYIIVFSLFFYICCYTVDLIDGSKYKNIQFDSIKEEFTLSKNSIDYSINDGYILEFNNVSRPMHFSFSYLISNVISNSTTFEGCDIRLTSTNKDTLLENEYKTMISTDIIFFRIRHHDKINLNDLPLYIDYNTSNYNMSGKYNTVDLFLDWKKKKVTLFLNQRGEWNIASLEKSNDKKHEITASFYHEDLPKDIIPNKVILYNFSPNSTCSIKNIRLCDNFCTISDMKIYKQYMNSKFLSINNIIYNILVILLLYK